MTEQHVYNINRSKCNEKKKPPKETKETKNKQTICKQKPHKKRMEITVSNGSSRSSDARTKARNNFNTMTQRDEMKNEFGRLDYQQETAKCLNVKPI